MTPEDHCALERVPLARSGRLLSGGRYAGNLVQGQARLLSVAGLPLLMSQQFAGSIEISYQPDVKDAHPEWPDTIPRHRNQGTALPTETAVCTAPMASWP